MSKLLTDTFIPEARFLNLAFSNRYKADIEIIYSRLLPHILTQDLVNVLAEMSIEPVFNDIGIRMIQTEIENREKL